MNLREWVKINIVPIANNPRVQIAVKTTVSITALVYLYHITPVDELVRAIQRIGSLEMGIILFVVLAKMVVVSHSLNVLLSSVTPFRLWEAIQVNALTTVANSVIPSSAAGVISAPVLIQRRTDLSYSSALYIKLIQFICISSLTGIFTIIGVVVLVEILPRSLLLIFAGAGALYLTVPILVAVGDGIAPTLLSYLPDVIQGRHAAARGSVPQGTIISAWVLLFAATLLTIGRFALVSTSFSVSFPLLTFVFLPFLAYSVTIYPVSVGGVGVAESAGVSLMIALGVSPGIASAVIITDRTLGAYLPLLISYAIAGVSNSPRL